MSQNLTSANNLSVNNNLTVSGNTILNRLTSSNITSSSISTPSLSLNNNDVGLTITNINNNISTLQTNYSSLNSNLTTVQNKLITDEANITNLQTRLTTDESNISSLQTSVSSLNTNTAKTNTSNTFNTTQTVQSSDGVLLNLQGSTDNTNTRNYDSIIRIIGSNNTNTGSYCGQYLYPQGSFNPPAFILSAIDGSSNNISFGTNNTNRMVIKSDGKIGINTTNPADQLHVVGNTTIGGNINITGDYKVNGNSITLRASGKVDSSYNLTHIGVSSYVRNGNDFYFNFFNNGGLYCVASPNNSSNYYIANVAYNITYNAVSYSVKISTYQISAVGGVTSSACPFTFHLF